MDHDDLLFLLSLGHVSQEEQGWIAYLFSFGGERAERLARRSQGGIRLEGDSTPVRRELGSGKDGASRKQSSVRSAVLRERASESQAGGLAESVSVPCCHQGASRAKTKQGILPSCSKYPQLSALSPSPTHTVPPLRRQRHSPPGLTSLQQDPGAIEQPRDFCRKPTMLLLPKQAVVAPYSTH